MRSPAHVGLSHRYNKLLRSLTVTQSYPKSKNLKPTQNRDLDRLEEAVLLDIDVL